MSEAATLAIIRDLFVLCGLALAMALVVYAMLRAGGGPSWNCEGEVLSRPYGWEDGAVALLLLGFFAWSSSAAEPAAASAPGGTGNTSVGPMMVGMIFMLMIAAVLLVYLRIRGLNPGELFGMRLLTMKAALCTAAGWLVLTYLLIMLEEKFFGGNWPDKSTQDPVKVFQQAGGPLHKLLFAAGAVIIAPIAEETIFRGFIYGVVKSVSDRWFSALFTSLVFAGVHQHVGSLPVLFVLAMGFALAYEATGCLLVPMFMHALFNALNLALLASGHS